MAMLAHDLALLPLTVLAATFGVIGFAPSAEAAFPKDIVDASSGEALGSITFPAMSGSSPAGLTFDLEGFTEVDIKSVSWELDQVTLEVQSLTLHALQGDDPCPGSFNVACSNSTLDLTDQQFQTGGTSCTGAPPGGSAVAAPSRVFRAPSTSLTAHPPLPASASSRRSHAAL